ncbi:imidazole glycerol phosphate synthase, glutamine amidotransferase subunit [Beutenbergia cavernae DSM 12333]|uniref:Imidazole glycerol phosphate synthase subunit HisH n=1 Tax=Beutenbergia cavernae (strain ATCC BAA-8 / DSM 12333 / CCUG 43141 / JCM 11478 / NBRC 16432 / NCIMB 13614 / HKI 0122) TaxID=471853 RepID=C5BW39_BEUC1|nr:imidazole glycerol phosphate synthase subunit HisH [Beutenbergia cavernae]ACQ80640.1 imidazole glycerol phosphate synthase, glutamine amidotransferase subunit [Beutenbergia cavernae DSM 12333]
MSRPSVVVLDYGSGNVHSAVRALERAGSDVALTADPGQVAAADGLVVPGVGAFAAVMDALTAVGGPRLIERRLAGGRPVLGVCVGLQVMFAEGVEHGSHTPGLAQWPGVVARLKADIVPHMGWSHVTPPEGSVLFRGVEDERFYFVHSYGVATSPAGDAAGSPLRPPQVTWATHGSPFVAAVENGALSATQFHPEKSGDAGAVLLRNWVTSLR